MKQLLKLGLHRFSQILVLPLVLPCKLEQWFTKEAELIFNMFAQFVSLFPGMPGAFLRRAFYTLTLEQCSRHTYIGFGSIFSDRCVHLEDYVYIGSYASIGSVKIGKNTLIGSRTSIISGKNLHEFEADGGTWSPFSYDQLTSIDIAKNVWVGESAVIVANIGEGSMVGAGTVVTVDVKPYITVSGNPARFIKNNKV